MGIDDSILEIPNSENLGNNMNIKIVIKKMLEKLQKLILRDYMI